MPTTSYVDFTAAARGIGARTDNVGAAVNDMSAEEDRLIHTILTEGVLSADAFEVTATGGMNLTVGSGSAKTDLACLIGTASGQGPYLVRLEAATLAVVVPAADGAQARTDEVYLIVADAPYDSGAVSLPRIGYRKGDAGGGAPGPDAAWKAHLLLASVAVPAGDTNISSPAGQVTDERVLATFVEALIPAEDPQNGYRSFADAAARDAAITAPEPWMAVFLEDDEIVYRYVGGAWVKWESAWMAYTPESSWSSGGGGATGNGTAVGAYRYDAGDIEASFTFTFGSTTTIGTGRLHLSVPVQAHASHRGKGSGKVEYPALYGMLPEVRLGESKMQFLRTDTQDWILHNSPVAFGSGDVVSGAVRYRPA
jgi:hypothetical protein